MPSFEITCEDCGQPYTAIRKNAKYCRVCRLLRNAIYLGDRTQTCLICEQDYAPLQRDKLSICGSCNPNSYKHDVEGTCVFCKTKDGRLIHEDIKVCRRCAQDPEQRELFIKALGKKKAQRCAA